jgi:hypothetical protein
MAPPRQRAIDTFFTALAPSEGSSLLQPSPDFIHFGTVPLRRWKLWSQPQRLTLHNTARHPLRWELECPIQINGEVRILADGRLLRRVQGVLPPGGKEELALVAAGRKGQRHGTLTLRCGMHVTRIAWSALVQPGIKVGKQFARRLSDLDLTQPDLLPALEALLEDGVLTRWLRAQGQSKQAAELENASQQPFITPLERRILIVHLLHPLDPQRFPLLRIHGAAPLHLSVAAGTTATHILEVENAGTSPCRIAWHSHCHWARLESTGSSTTLQPGQRWRGGVVFSPPLLLQPGPQQMALELRAGTLLLPLSFTVQVTAKPWWQHVINWLAGR